MSQQLVADIAQILASTAPANPALINVATVHQANLTKPAGALGRLEELAIWYAGLKGDPPAPGERHWLHPIVHPRVALFAGSHGVTQEGVSAFPATVNEQMVANFQAGGAAINQLALEIDADFQVYELLLEHPTGNIATEDAMSEDEVETLFSYGAQAVGEPVDVLILGDMGIGNTTASAALVAAVVDGAYDPANPQTAEKWIGRGTGIDDQTLRQKIKAVQAALARCTSLITRECQTPDQKITRLVRLLGALGGREHVAMLGAIMAAGKARIPVLLDGYVTAAAAAVYVSMARATHAETPAPATTHPHLCAVHQSAEPGHPALLEWMGLSPLLTWNMRLGEGAGATLGVPMLKAAISCHNGMARFQDAGVDDKTPTI
ncbi:MAG: nicotinate-nucleotide--dimethylbenzimidazole phosphoribosyltransferase [Alphaproteobacteria bacterium]|nr:nicotinate-nucleotide--dimethylbenzimidazole phosphoribosyltransferase [Alphaproteobacteria bacterium]